MSPKAKAILYLLTAALIWGCSYPIGRAALEHLTPLAYSSLRFMFGTLSLVPLALRWRRRPAPMAYSGNVSPNLWLWGGMLSGLCLSIGSILQLSGLAQSSAGKVGFITTLYVSMVPVLAFVIGYVPRMLILAGLGVGLVGLYLLTGGASGLGKSEGLVLVADVFWATQVLITGRFAARVNTWLFSLAQAMTSSAITLTLAFSFDQMPSWPVFIQTLPYTMWGILSVGVAYTCQTIAQRTISSTSAALVFPLQSVIGAVAGMVFLGEHMSQRMMVGAAIIIIGCIVAQFARESSRVEPDHRHWKKLLMARIALGVTIGLGAAGTLVWSLT
ncbi:hypothetical protein C4J81_05365 [Deltaproteobacteria bacterium Smac51]|nr:hypothetical protein C4J81_05365 [Deltaproteobacteria bacterium Smac51]